MFQAQSRPHKDTQVFPMNIEYGTGMACGRTKDEPYTMQLPHAFKQASLKMEHIRPGMFISVLDFTPMHDISVDVETEYSPLVFGAIISGSCDIEYRTNKGKKNTYRNIPQEMVGRSNLISGKCTLSAHTRVQMVSISLSNALIPEILEGHEEYEMLQKKMCTKQDSFQIIGQWKLSPDMYRIASQVLYCPLQGKNRALYMESKALEILALQLEKLQSRPMLSTTIPRNDMEKLHEARHLLFASMEEPPSIQALARQVGLNDFKLKQGFRKLFNNTVYGSLRKYRMETARTLLLSGDATVTEAAISVGYSNISHFITAFRKQYTINPGVLLKNTSAHFLP